MQYNLEYLTEERQWRNTPLVHSNPIDYGLTSVEVYKMKLRYLLDRQGTKHYLPPIKIPDGRVLREIQYYSDAEYYKSKSNATKDATERELWQSLYLLAHNIDKEQNKRILSLKRLVKKPETAKPDYDVQSLKNIPLDTIVAINSQGFFKVREEKTPSCYWYKKTNTWVDFGGDNRRHDAVDLVQLIHSLTFLEACKFLAGH